MREIKKEKKISDQSNKNGVRLVRTPSHKTILRNQSLIVTIGKEVSRTSISDVIISICTQERKNMYL